MSGLSPPPQDGLALRDIHVPRSPSWWPLAPGWWVLLGVVCVIAVAAYLLYRHARGKRTVREQILAEIELLAARHPDDDAAYAASLHQLLRRAARCYAAEAHRVQGDNWRDVLARVPVDTATLDALMTLDRRMYQAHADFDRSGVQAAARHWLDTSLRHTKTTEVGHA